MQLLPISTASGRFVSLLTACGAAQADSPTTSSSEPTMTQISAGVFETQGQSVSHQQAPDEVVLPEPKIELPELPYDKAQLSKILILDEMITAAQRLEAAGTAFGESYTALERSSNASMNGTKEDQLRALMGILAGFESFEREGLALGQAASQRFQDAYTSDDEFTSTYRETYSLAEAELDEVIKDGVVRRATFAAMSTTYKYPPGVNASYLDSQLSSSVELKAKTIQRVIDGTSTDLMVADYKKGKALVDLLQISRSKLTLVSQLDPGNAAIVAALAQVDEKEASRQKEIQEARSGYRLPARFSGGNAVADPAPLENAMRSALSQAGHEVKSIVCASGWIAVNSPLGIHLYNQLDFYVAVTSPIAAEAKAGVLDVLYVTGKTGGTELTVPFGRYSAGRLAQMLAENL